MLKSVRKLHPFLFISFSHFTFLSTLPVLILACCLKPLAWMTLRGPISSCLFCLTHHEFTCWGHLLIASASPMGYHGNYTEHWLGSFSFKHLGILITHAVIAMWILSCQVKFHNFFPAPFRIILTFTSAHCFLLQTNDSEGITWQACQTL